MIKEDDSLRDRKLVEYRPFNTINTVKYRIFNNYLQIYKEGPLCNPRGECSNSECDKGTHAVPFSVALDCFGIINTFLTEEARIREHQSPSAAMMNSGLKLPESPKTIKGLIRNQ